MRYTTVRKTAERWGVSEVYVYSLCQNGRIPGAVRAGKYWYIPADAKKPVGTGPVGTLPASKKAKEWGFSMDVVARLCELGQISGAVHNGRSWYVPEDAVYPLEGYISVPEMAEKWGISRAFVSELCKDGRIPGAVRAGKYWYIPADAKKPVGTGPVGTLPASKKAKEWGFSMDVVARLCELGQISGAVHNGRSWYVPEDAVYPLEGYISVPEMAEKWGVSRALVSKYCKEGHIPGVKRVGRIWHIPADAERPGRYCGNGGNKAKT